MNKADGTSSCFKLQAPTCCTWVNMYHRLKGDCQIDECLRFVNDFNINYVASKLLDWSITPAVHKGITEHDQE